MSLLRYKVARTPDLRRFVIYDRELGDDCGLPDEDGAVQTLTWMEYDQADAWLRRCYRAWGGTPLVTGEMVDLTLSTQSPWHRGTEC